MCVVSVWCMFGVFVFVWCDAFGVSCGILCGVCGMCGECVSVVCVVSV